MTETAEARFAGRAHAPLVRRRRAVAAATALTLAASSCGHDTSLPPEPKAAVIEEVSAASAFAGQLVTIRGSGFDPDLVSNQVVFPRATARAKRFVDGGIEVRVPPDAGSGPISVTTPRGVGAPFGSFRYLGLGQLRRGSIVQSVPLLHQPKAVFVADREQFVWSSLVGALVGANGEVLGRNVVDAVGTPFSDGLVFIDTPSSGATRISFHDNVTGKLVSAATSPLAKLAATVFNVEGERVVEFRVDGQVVRSQLRDLRTLQELGPERTLSLTGISDAVDTLDGRLLFVGSGPETSYLPMIGLMDVGDGTDAPAVSWLGEPMTGFASGRDLHGTRGHLAVGYAADGVTPVAALASDYGTVTLVEFRAAPPASGYYTRYVASYSGSTPDGVAIVNGVVLIAYPADGLTVGASYSTARALWSVQGVEPTKVLGRPTTALVADRGQNRLQVIDVATGRVIGAVPFDLEPGRMLVDDGLVYDPGTDYTDRRLLFRSNLPSALLEYPLGGLGTPGLVEGRFQVSGVVAQGDGQWAVYGETEDGQGWLSTILSSVDLPSWVFRGTKVGTSVALAHGQGIMAVRGAELFTGPRFDATWFEALTPGPGGLYASWFEGHPDTAERRLQLWTEQALLSGGEPSFDRAIGIRCFGIMALEDGVWVIWGDEAERQHIVRFDAQMGSEQEFEAVNPIFTVGAVSPNLRTFVHWTASLANQTTLYVSSADPETGFEELAYVPVDGIVTGLTFDESGERLYAVTQSPDRIVLIE